MVEPEATGFETVTEALSRRSDDTLAVEMDPRAIEAAELARTHTLKELTEERRRLNAVLATQPPSVADQIAREERRLAFERARHEAMQRAKPGWKLSSRQQVAQKVESLERSVRQREDRVTELRAQQGQHDAFAIEHTAEFDRAHLLARASSTRRLSVRISAVADPPQAALDLLGHRPTSQRDRLRWDSAVENLAVYLDERGHDWPDRAASLRDLLGERPKQILDRYEHDRVAKSVQEAISAPGRDLKHGLSLGR